MTQNQQLKKILGLVGTTCYSLLLGLPAMAQSPEASPTPNQQPTDSNSVNTPTGSAVLNPCPSIVYDPKYKDRVSVPAGCPATSATPADSKTVSSPTSPGLNPCPGIFYESKYKDTVGLPANCAATPPTPQQ